MWGGKNQVLLGIKDLKTTPKGGSLRPTVWSICSQPR